MKYGPFLAVLFAFFLIAIFPYYAGNDEPTLITTDSDGDGVADINIRELVNFHKSHGKLATVTAVRPPARFGSLNLEDNNVMSFAEKSQLQEGWINGGYFVFEPEITDYINNDETYLEREPLEQLARDGQLMAFKHSKFWQPMDTLSDLQTLKQRWESQDAPWKVWK